MGLLKRARSSLLLVEHPRTWHPKYNDPHYTNLSDIWAIGMVILYCLCGWPKSQYRSGLGWCADVVLYADEFLRRHELGRRRGHRALKIRELIGLVTQCILILEPVDRMSAARCLQEGRLGLGKHQNQINADSDGQQPDGNAQGRLRLGNHSVHSHPEKEFGIMNFEDTSPTDPSDLRAIIVKTVDDCAAERTGGHSPSRIKSAIRALRKIRKKDNAQQSRSAKLHEKSATSKLTRAAHVKKLGKPIRQSRRLRGISATAMENSNGSTLLP